MRNLFLMLMALWSLSGDMNAQITIGSFNSTSPYEILRIDGSKSGLRLSRLTTKERNDLNVENNVVSTGLLIYNTDTQSPEFWDGGTWIPIPLKAKSQVFTNGLSDTSENIQLGGKLTENTVINQNNNDFSFTLNDGGSYTINNNAFSVDYSDVKANGLTDFSINDTVFNLSNEKELSIRTGNTGIFINGNVFNIIDNEVNINGQLQYSDGNEVDAGIKTLVLSSMDSGGKANWVELTPTTSFINIPITRNAGPASGGSSYYFTVNEWTDITQSFTLTPGKWMILGHFTSYTSRQTTTNNYVSELRLYDKTNGQSVYTTQRLPECKSTSGNADSGAFANPSMTTFISVDSSTNYQIQFRTARDRTWYILRTWIPEPFFTAIRIND